MKAHSIAAVVVAIFPFVSQPAAASSTAEPQQGQRGNFRFLAMDTNRDGRITRAEWRGNDRSFRNHDWNNDGVLSGDEIRLGAARQRAGADDTGFYDWTAAGFREIDRNRDNRISRSEWQYDDELFMRADRNRDNILSRAEFLGNDTTDLDREDRFDDLDTNNNGRIDRAEWHGTLDAFEWLDRNNDGRLSREETVGNTTEGTTGSTASARRVVVVSSQERWTDTGINLRAGDRLRIHAEGTVTLSDNASDSATPGGAGRRAVNAPFPDMPAGGLIARIGDGAPFYIGEREIVDRASTTGRLYLSVNDDHLPDNRGQFRVTVSIDR